MTKQKNTRRFSYDEPIAYQDSLFPSTQMDIEDDKGNVSSRNVFADASGRYYTLDNNGNTIPIVLQNNLDEVTVTAPRKRRDWFNDYLTMSNDATKVFNVPHREYNPHLKEATERGAESHALWEKEHPNATAWGNALASVPFAVAATPLVAAVGDAAAGTAIGQYIGNGLNMVANAASNSSWLPWADTLTSSYFAAHGLQNMANGNFTPETALEVAPLMQMAKPMYNAGKEAASFASNWRPFVPWNSNRYYRIVGETGNPIGDAIESGVIRGPGAVPGYREAVKDALSADGNTITLLPKAHSYPMFSKGKPWGGSTARVAEDYSKKPTIIRSKSDTGPIVWEESNKHFNHKGHNGIYRPRYNGDLNAAPTKYFEYWEPRKFGYMRKDFPIDNNPYHNLMGTGYNVDRGAWTESSLGVQGERFGEYLGSGGEQTVFEDLNDKENVLKVYHDTYTKDMPGLEALVNSYLQRNSVPLQSQASFSGYVKDGTLLYPVFSQERVQPLGKMSNAEYTKKYLPLIQEALESFGYSGDGINSEFTNGVSTLVDIKPENVGFTPSNDLRFFDVVPIKNK